MSENRLPDYLDHIQQAAASQLLDLLLQPQFSFPQQSIGSQIIHSREAAFHMLDGFHDQVSGDTSAAEVYLGSGRINDCPGVLPGSRRTGS